jgi:hypothetical protein
VWLVSGASTLFHGYMALAVGDFYISASFWVSAFGAVAGVLGTIAIVLVTIWIGRPRRRLLYWMPVSTPLLNAGQDVRRKLEVRCGGKTLSDPRVLEIGLFNQGRLDIPTTAFNAHEPLLLDVGAPIIEVLSSATVPANRVEPAVHVDGTTLRIGPSLIPKRQTFTVSILVDGPALLRCVKPQLVDVDVDPRRQDSNHDLLGYVLGHRGGRLALVAGTVSLVLLLVIGLVIGHVFAAPVATSVGCSFTGTMKPGQTVQMTYHFDSSAARQVGLGAGLYNNAGIDNSTGTGDISDYQLSPGKTAKTRPVPIPAHLKPGRYELDAELWPPNEVGQNGVQTITTATCGYMTVP